MFIFLNERVFCCLCEISCLFRVISLFSPALSLSSTLPESCNYFPTSFATSVKISRTFLCLKSFSPIFPVPSSLSVPLSLSFRHSVSFCAVLALNINGGKVFIAAHGVWSGEEEGELELAIKNVWQIFILNLRSAEKVLL